MITIPRKQLADELSLLSGAIENKGVLPVLACVRLVFDGQVAHLTTSSIDVTISTQVEGSGEAWSACLPYKQLATLVKALYEDAVTISPHGDDRCEVRAGRSRTKLVTLPVEQFPEPDKHGAEAVTFTVNGAALRQGLARVLPCVTTEESRYSMQGVQFEGDGQALRLVATDSHRLGVATIPNVQAQVKTLVPVDGLRALLSLDSETITIELSDNLAIFRADTRTITSRLLTGTFPNCQMIMPKELPYRIELDAEQLSAALKRAAITRQETFKAGVGVVRGGVKLSLASDSLAVIVDKNERGAFDEAIDATSNLNGQPMETRLNPDYLSDFLATHEGRFIWQWKNSQSQMLFSWPEQNFECVIMPMRV
jgi:DNA polymerase-3 subunit beta